MQKWSRIALFNLLLVAAIGCVLRYKIIFPLSIVDQKQLLDAHSHFAFGGWVSQALMALMVGWLSVEYGEGKFKKYRWLLYINLITSYGMLVCFSIEGYGISSISFSTLSIINSYFFTIFFWRDMARMKKTDTVHYWFKAALIFNTTSSLGAFSLAWMMATREFHLTEYLEAQYFYLHFQYNGWFFFSGMGLLTSRLMMTAIRPQVLNRIFWLFLIACPSAYFLSALWIRIPLWIYLLVIISAVMQLAGWAETIRIIKNNQLLLKTHFPLAARRILLLSAIALSIKLLLQLGSTIPSLSTLAFGYRPIVIGYLHLVLLAVITLFLLGSMLGSGYISVNPLTYWGIGIFSAGIVINELLLMSQGASGMGYLIIPYANESLFVAALILFSGVGLIFSSQFRKK